MELIETAALAAGTTVLGAALSYGAQRVMVSYSAGRTARAAEASSRTEEVFALRQAVTALQLDNALLKKDVLPLSLAVQQWAVEKLTHNHTPEMDALLARIGSLTAYEMERLDDLLKERVVEYDDPEIDAIERLAATMLPNIVKWAQEASQVPKDTVDLLQMVSTPPGPDEEKPEEKPK